MLVADSLQSRIEELRRSPAYANYERARDEVLRMKERDAGRDGSDPSTYWQEELAGFEYLFDASPLMVDKLRHQCYHVTGLKVYDYRSHKDRGREQIAAKLERLVELGGLDL